MRVLLVGAVIALAFAGAANAQGVNSVRGYIRSDGTYVAPHMRTNPNDTTADNYSTRPNVNPYTGQEGTRQPTFGAQTYQLPTYAPAYQQPGLGGGIQSRAYGAPQRPAGGF